MDKKRVIIMGAAGRDFHNFNVYFRNHSAYEVVAFTATQIPNIEGRIYPRELAGRHYPKGIPIFHEDKLLNLIQEKKVDQVVFSYSDITHEYVMHRASRIIGAGADFVLLGNRQTMLKARVPVIAICAVRTGCGKSQTTRRVSQILKDKKKRIVIIRHPMPYGDLVKQMVQRFENHSDLDRYDCTIEEREEYEPHLDMGNVVYAGVDYGCILKEAEKEADIILWDGGNNDAPFYQPDCLIVVTDPHRAGHEMFYYPGETNFLTADVIVMNKMDTAKKEDAEVIRQNVHQFNPRATLIEAASPIVIDDPSLIRNKRVLVVEDGPTLTHGGMTYGAGIVAAKEYGAKEIVDPRPWVTGAIQETFQHYPDIGQLLPAMGYGEDQIHDLEATINRVECEAVIIGTPVDLSRLITINKPTVRVQYKLQEIGEPTLEDVLHGY